LALLLDELAPRDHDVHAALVDLDDRALDLLADELADVGLPADRDLRRGQEGRHADVHDEAALDLAQHLAADGVALLVGRDDALPPAQPVRLALAELDLAGLVLDPVEEHLDLVADVDLLGVLELRLGDDPLRLVADVDDHVLVDDVDDAALQDGVGLEGPDP